MSRLLCLAFIFGAAAQGQSVVSVLPADGAAGVPTNARIIVTVNFGSYFLSPFKVTNGATAVSGSTKISGSWFMFTPDKAFDPQTTYKVEFDSPSFATFFASFATGTAADNTPLQLVSSNPSNGQDGVSATGSMTLHFNKTVSPYSFQQGQFSILDLTSGYSVTDYYFGPQLQPDGSTLVFNFASSNSYGLSLGHAFQFRFPSSGITDWLGNPLSPVPGAIEFTTFRTVEKAGPVPIGTTPADGETGVAINSNIVLVFDKPLAQIPWDSAVALDSGGPLKFKLDNTLAGGRALVIQPALLLAPNSLVSVKVSGLMDAYGAPLTAPINIAFHTGIAAEIRQLLMNAPPSVPLSRNDAIQATFNRAIDPLLLSLGGVKVYPSQDYTNFVAVPSQLSADHLTVGLNPGSPLPPGSYSASISVPFDRTAGKLAPFVMNFTLTGDIDTTPPQVLALTPPDGTTDAPVTALIQVAFSEPVIAANAAAAPFQLLENGSPVAGAFSLNGSQGTFAPKAALDPSATYRISISGVTDLAGNPLAAFSASFATTAASQSSAKFQVTGIVPASNATAGPSTPIVLTFNRAIDPVSVYLQSSRFMLLPSSSYLSAPGAFRVSGSVLTFTPASPLAAGSHSLQVSGITDLAGNSMTQVYSAFTIAGPLLDSTPPRVISVSPGDGQPVLYSNPYVVFTFSKPIDPSTLSGSNIAAYGPTGYIAVRATILAGYTQVAVTFSANPGAPVTLVVTPGVMDFSGNPAMLFRTTVRMSDHPVTTGAAVVLLRPGYPSSTTNVSPNTGLTLLFNAPVDRASVERGLLVTANGAFVSGRVDWSPDSMGLTFVSSTPYPYSAAVNVAIVYPAKDAAGNDVSYSNVGESALKIADAPPAPPTSLAVIASNLPSLSGLSPLDSVMELQFSQDVAAGLGVGTLTDNSAGPGFNQVISCTATLIRPRVIRFTPQSSLRPGDLYKFSFDSGNGLTWSQYIWAGTAASATNSPYVAAAGPADRSVALNAQVTVAFSSAVAEFLMPGGLTLQSGGAAVPTRYSWSAGDRALTLTPMALLHADTDYTVSTTGFEDLAGHSIPNRTWTFHTSSAIDLQAPAVMHTEPAGNAVSANAVVAVTFSKPVAADWIGGFTMYDNATTPGTPVGGGPVAGGVRFSDDQRTAFFTPAQPLAAGHYYSIIVPLADDFCGNVPGGVLYQTTSTSIRVGFGALSAPLVVLATPDDGSSGLPLNAQFQAQFDQPVLASSLGGVALFENDAPLPATARVEADGRTVTALPQRLPAAGSTVKFLVAGVKNTDGVAMAGAYRASVNLGQTVDTSPPAFRSSPGNGQSETPLNVKVRLRFNKPLNKLTVNARNIALTRNPYNAVVDAAVDLQDSGRTVTIAPTVALTSDTTHCVSLNGVSDLSGNTLGGNPYIYGCNVGFSTSSGAPAAPPVLLAFDPPDGSQDLPANPNIQMVYSQPVDLTLGDDSLQLFAVNLRQPPRVLSGQTGAPARTGYGRVTGTVGGSNGQITFAPALPLEDGAYRIQTSGIADVSGNPIAPVSSTFTVAPNGNKVSPSLVSSTPAMGAVGVPVSSAIKLYFNKTVSSVSAAQLQVSWQGGGAIHGTFQAQDSAVTFTPAAPLPGAASISVTGYVKDPWGLQGWVSLGFTTGANSDTTPPTLVFAYPAQGSVVPPYGTNLVLRFSEPVTAVSGVTPVQILAGASLLSSTMLQSEDGRTLTANINLPPDTDITVGVTSGLVDFAGNPIQPVSIHFRTATDAATRGPQVLSVSPADGAVNVNVDSPIVLQFSHAMEPVSVAVGLQATDAGATITGSTSGDSTAQVFTFRPDLSYRPGSTVEVFAGSSIFDATGARIGDFYSHFGTLAPQAGAGQAVSVSASANAIDVRFSGRVPAGASQAYLRRGMALVPAEVVAAGVDQIRVIPSGPLDPGAVYHLVLDATQELAIQLEKETDDEPGEVAILPTPGAIRMRFSQPVNPLSVLRGVRLLGPDGASVGFTTQTSLDRTEMFLAPAALAGPFTVVIDGVESRAGRRLERQVRRPR